MDLILQISDPLVRLLPLWPACLRRDPAEVWVPAAEVASQRGVSVQEALAELATETQARIPLGDFTRPEDIAAAVTFLASDDARHITGSKLIVDGGVVECNTFHYSTASTRKV